MSPAVGLWRGTHINIALMAAARCLGRGGREGGMPYPASWELGGAVSCGYWFLRLAMRPVSAASVLFLAFLRSGPSAVGCVSHSQHLPRRNSCGPVHNIISAAEREGKAWPAVPRSSVCPPGEFNSGASVQWTNIFTIKTCRPPHTHFALTLPDIRRVTRS